MDGEWLVGNGFLPLVPPPRGEAPEDLLAMQRRGVEMIAAANRLAMGWLQAAAEQHAEVTRRALEDMAETTRRLAGAGAPPEAAAAMLDMLHRAQALGLGTAEEIAGLTRRMQGDTLALMEQWVRGGRRGG